MKGTKQACTPTGRYVGWTLDKVVDDVVQRSIAMHKESLKSDITAGVVCTQSTPVPWFGDIDSFMKSTKKIVTVGINPSCSEFHPKNRFPKATVKDPESIRKACNGYFGNSPYQRWFNSYERILNLVGVTYGGVYASADRSVGTAIHTDICSPIATNPSWSQLTAGQQRALKQANGHADSGSQLWCDLVSYLCPDVVLLGVGMHHLQNIPCLTSPSTWPSVYRRPNSNAEIRVYRQGCTTYIWGSSQNLPFGGLTWEEKSKHLPKLM